MKIKLLTALAVLAMAGVASADLLVANGDFELAGASWAEAQSGETTFTYETSGGSTLGAAGGAYAQLANPGAGWAVLVSPPEAGADGGGTLIADLGVTANALNNFQVDLKTFAGTAGGGLKIEAWGGNAILGNSGDVNAPGAFADWTTFTVPYFVPAGTDKIIMVPLWGAGSTVGYDNVGTDVVPEPATAGLLALAGLSMFVIRRVSRFNKIG